MSEKLLDGFGERCREGGRGSKKKEASAAPVSERKQEDKEKRK